MGWDSFQVIEHLLYTYKALGGVFSRTMWPEYGNMWTQNNTKEESRKHLLCGRQKQVSHKPEQGLEWDKFLLEDIVLL